MWLEANMRRTGLVFIVAMLAASAILIIREGTRGQTLVAGAVLAAIGLPLLVLSRRQLGKSFSVGPRATTLVTHGVYSKIPHPMYVFLDLALLGAVIATRQEWLVAVWLGLAAVHAWAARREARVLEKAFGDAYRAYRARAWW
jgi:protein-S-isoprenylcysteine O-methyltransferase Ste14